MQKELTIGPLLDEKGNLTEAGFAFRMVKEYDRSKIKAGKSRIKEWDYYYIGNSKYGIAFTIDDNSLYGLGSVSILDFENKTYITESSMNFFTKGKVGFPSNSSEGDITWNHKGYYLHFVNKDKKRVIDVNIEKYHDDCPFEAHFELTEIMDDSMVIATPFPKKAHFYYNEKKNCMVAKGYYTFKDQRIEFSEDDTRAILDWGRGVWTYKNTWYWSGLSGISDGKEVGFNLGYGFGDTSAASENMLFYDKKAYKLEDPGRHDLPLEIRGRDREAHKAEVLKGSRGEGAGRQHQFLRRDLDCQPRRRREPALSRLYRGIHRDAQRRRHPTREAHG